MEPIIKVRYKEKIFLIALFLLFDGALGGYPRCDKTPKDQLSAKTPGSNGFSVSVSGSPRKYRPEQVYTITISGQRDEAVAKFQGFMLLAEPALGNTAIQSPTSLGTFQLVPGDAMTKFSHKCSHSVEATSSMNKEQITVYWTSPPKGSGCIDFKSMIIERQDLWYMDDGDLTWSMCEDDAPLAEPTEVVPCCACDEAKYEAIFEGIWSRHTHPKDFPVDEWRTRFSTLIGASHSANYSLWEYGRPASQALQVLGEIGLTRSLESQMKRFSPTIRSVVKAHGLQQRSNVIGQTFAVFRVDRIHHLLSVVSKMIPSPDWIVGLSKENLCLPNCSWVDNRVIDLYPWDIGTDSGLRYDGPPSPQRPKGVIHRITSTNPMADESPFYDRTGAPMKPAARLHLIKQREYFKQCPDGMPRPGGNHAGMLNPSWNSPDAAQQTSYFYGNGIGQPTPEEIDEFSDYGPGPYSNPDQSSANDLEPPSYDYSGISPTAGFDDLSSIPDYGSFNDPCAVSDWGDWTECSASCDTGSQSRVRDYLDRSEALMSGCDIGLFEKRTCPHLPKCENRYIGSFNPFDVDSMSGISTPWLGTGFESKSYSYKGSPSEVPNHPYQSSHIYGYTKKAPKHNNQHTYSASYPHPYGQSYTYDGTYDSSLNDQSAQLVAAEELPMSQGLNSPMQDQAENNPFDLSNSCELSTWGDWSDCSSPCDSGSRTRNRRYINPESSLDCVEDLFDHQPCHGNAANCPPPREPQGTPDFEQPPVTGMGFGSYITNSYNSQDDEDPACQTTDWSDWSPCSSKCGSGYQRRTRFYTIPFVPNRSCDVRLYDKQDCYGQDPTCSGYDSYSYNTAVDEYEKSTNQVVQSNKIHHTVESLQDYDLSISPDAPEICNAPVDPGTCHSHSVRWYFDVDTASCLTFSYTGCFGNRNNFASKEKCEATCLQSQPSSNDYLNNPEPQDSQPYWSNSGSSMYDSTYQSQPDDNNDWGDMTVLSQIRDPILVNPPSNPPPEPDEYVDEDLPMRPLHPMDIEVDCQVSAWSTWSPCSESCGSGWQSKSREILIHPSHGGKTCPKKMSRRKKCRSMPCPEDTKYWYQGSWRHMVDPEDE